MAVLTDQSRAQVWADVMQELSRNGESIGVTKADLKAAIDALDSYMSTNAAAINTAIPQPARSALSNATKALFLMHVIQKRWVDGS